MFLKSFKIILIICFLFALIIISAGMGYMEIPPSIVFKVICSKIMGREDFISNIKKIYSVVIIDVRLPRILTASIVGGGLAVAGSVFQGILLNPLSDPYTLGVSSGAAFGASIALLFNISFLGINSVELSAFIFSLITLFFVIYLSSNAGGLSSNSLILAGIIVTSILSAGISFIKYLADEKVGVIIFWLMGSFESKTWRDVAVTSFFVAIGFMISLFFSRELNLLSLGDKVASSLGVDTNKIVLILLITSSLISAVCVSVSGIIGFVGLLVPHMTRALIGPDNRKLIPFSMLFGAILLLTADTIIRAFLPHEIPIGVLTALIGGPVFCYIFRRQAF
ncbi:MAG: iron ABC transporter permease [Desulfobacterales bacterium]|nr:iron ABC transporter permease [Desulfobacterales bacterium]MBF0395328.1 iron ABC transporter permease [Desulfobacterales bacterium]